VHRQKHSDKRLDERLEEQDQDQEQEAEERGILELFRRDVDAPLARDGEDDADAK
jgi:hypothetical protein